MGGGELFEERPRIAELSQLDQEARLEVGSVKAKGMPRREALSEDRASPIDLFEREPVVAELVADACQLQPGDTHIRMIGTGHGGVDLETALRRVKACG